MSIDPQTKERLAQSVVETLRAEFEHVRNDRGRPEVERVEQLAHELAELVSDAIARGEEIPQRELGHLEMQLELVTARLEVKARRRARRVLNALAQSLMIAAIAGMKGLA